MRLSMMGRGLAIGIVAWGCVLGCTGPKPPVAPVAETPRTWQSKLDVAHPLVGRIWDVRARRFVAERELLGSLGGFVLLGEKHDNADHHALQAEVLAAIVRAGSRPAVAFEMFDIEKQSAIDGARRERPKDADAIASAVTWETSGWPPWPLYAPIVRTALDAELPIVATGLGRAAMRGLVRDASAPTPGRPLDEEARESLAKELVESHCGQLPEAMVPGMIRVQRARDASMAEALVASATPSRVSGVLVAGTGHTRIDRGAGKDLGAEPARRVVSIAFAEVEAGRVDPPSYASRWHARTLPFDYVWFTPRATDEDPCAEMRKKP
jgi:uncharacterized iron-regulated protein